MPETPPPASLSFLNAMRETQVTGDDLIEENNKECLVCLDENRLGGMAVKMPCGHLYHKECISEWLRKQGSCPVCRYEVESSDPMYEVERKKRMRNTRKLRMRRDELKKKKVEFIGVMVKFLWPQLKAMFMTLVRISYQLFLVVIILK